VLRCIDRKQTSLPGAGNETTKGSEKTFGSDGNLFQPDCSGGFMTE
jgi:hypothetical protein